MRDMLGDYGSAVRLRSARNSRRPPHRALADPRLLRKPPGAHLAIDQLRDTPGLLDDRPERLPLRRGGF